MYKLLIVDDEKMIREGMKNGIEWNMFDIGQVFTAGSGKEALEIIEKELPDILLTDINMNEMTGLELVEKAYEVMPKIRAIILTGYDFFEYARDAVRLHVQEFLLKPVDEDLLVQCVQKQVNELEAEKKKTDFRAEGVYEQSELERQFRNLCKEEANMEAVLFFEKRYNAKKEDKITTAIIIPNLECLDNVDDRDYQYNHLRLFLMNEIDQSGKGITINSAEDNGLVVVLFDDRTDVGSTKFIQNLQALIITEIGQRPKIAVGLTVIGFQNIKTSVQEARKLLYKPADFYDSELLITGETKKRYQLFSEVYNELIKRIEGNVDDKDYVLKVYDTYCRAADSYEISDHDSARSNFLIVSAIYFEMVKQGKTLGNRLLEELANSTMFVSREECYEIYRKNIEAILSVGDKDVYELVSRAKTYINQHLSDNLSVSEIAEGLYVSPNYFSRLFKKDTGEGCNEYIVRKRLEKAKHLLSATTMNIGKISEAVGYNDSNYFSMSFKKSVGISPTQYRNDSRGEEK